MARITKFRVEGLAGRGEPYAAELQRDANVFFGINGSGKTTLLKILHSALSADTAILEGLPFASAEVEVYLNRYQSTFKRVFRQPEAVGSAEPQPRHRFPEYRLSDPRVQTEERPKWQSEPREPDGRLTRRVGGFLPITRLYRAVKAGPTGVRAMSEEELDERFAREVQRIWTDYCAEISTEISQVQEKGLANILHFVLSGEDAARGRPRCARRDGSLRPRFLAFLGRQPRLTDVLGSQERFLEKYRTNPEIRRIVKQIDTIENQIATSTAPRQRFQNLLESMYSGNKRIVFSEKEIGVEMLSKGKIDLPSLSSGEKQLFLIALESLKSGDHALIIDEPELSMHVDWQRKLVASLLELNPKMQLIIATHSPEIMADPCRNEYL